MQSGYFSIRDGGFVTSAPAGPAAGDRPGTLRNVTSKSTVSEDLTVQGDACIGNSCTTTDTAATHGLRIKDSAPMGIYFDDTQDGFSGSHDWMIAPNPLGYGDLFSIVDIDDVHGFTSVPFSIQGGAPYDSLYVRANGNVGIGGFPDANAKLHVVGTATSDTFAGLGPSPNSGPSFNLG